jgi:hypothetical protein
VRFRAPVAITRADRHYTLTMEGPAAASCRRRIPGGGDATTRDIAKGELVTFHYQTPTTRFRGHVLGTYRFTIR